MQNFPFALLLLVSISQPALALSPLLPNGVTPTELRCAEIFSEKYCIYITDDFLLGLYGVAAIAFLAAVVIFYRKHRRTRHH